MNSVFDNTELKQRDPEVTALLQQFAVKIREARLYRQRSQVYVAKKAGISQKVVSQLESGKDIHLSTYIKLCLALQLAPAIRLKSKYEAVTWSEKNKQYSAKNKADKGEKLDDNEKEIL